MTRRPDEDLPPVHPAPGRLDGAPHSYLAPRGLRWIVVLSSVAGVLLFAGTLRYVVSWQDMLDGIRRVGWGFGVICLLGGLRFATRALAWMACVAHPSRLGFRAAFEAVVASDALGTLVPAGPLASEPAKVIFISRALPLNAGVASVAIENLLYTLSAGLMIATGAFILLQTTALPGSMRLAIDAAAAAFAAVALVLVALARTSRRPGRWLADAVARTGPRPRLQRWLHTLVDLEDRTLGFAADRPWRWLAVFLLEVTFHALAVVEIWLTLVWLLPPDAAPSLLGAFVLESSNRLITVLFKFVPFRVGVDEAGTAAVSAVLGFGPALGATQALLRKGRTLCWTAVGVALLARRGWLTRRSLQHDEPDGRRERAVE